ncbi:MAG: hypothetical protein R3A52_27535 [Polyangiales bacterium]
MKNIGPFTTRRGSEFLREDEGLKPTVTFLTGENGTEDDPSRRNRAVFGEHFLVG